jgi:hypothetical protein
MPLMPQNCATFVAHAVQLEVLLHEQLLPPS